MFYGLFLRIKLRRLDMRHYYVFYRLQYENFIHHFSIVAENERVACYELGKSGIDNVMGIHVFDREHYYNDLDLHFSDLQSLAETYLLD